MTETRKSQKKIVKESLIMAEGGTSYDFTSLDTCILKTSEVSPDMGCLIIVLLDHLASWNLSRRWPRQERH